MLPYLVITWLYVTGGLALWSLAAPWERADGLFALRLVAWPVKVTWHIVFGVFSGVRGVIGK